MNRGREEGERGEGRGERGEGRGDKGKGGRDEPRMEANIREKRKGSTNFTNYPEFYGVFI
jgi:hypothetical protein